MHDVAIAVNLHELMDGDAARLTDTTEVVSPEIHEHQVLSPLLRVGQQLGRKFPVLPLGASPRPRPSDGARGGNPVLNGDERLGAGTHDSESGKPQQVQIRAGIGQAQGPVDLQRVG